jgi:hypothetical protein
MISHCNSNLHASREIARAKSQTYSEASGSFASCPARHFLVYCWNPRAPWFATCFGVRIALRWVGLELERGGCRSSSFPSVRQRWPRSRATHQLAAQGLTPAVGSWQCSRSSFKVCTVRCTAESAARGFNLARRGASATTVRAA